MTLMYLGIKTEPWKKRKKMSEKAMSDSEKVHFLTEGIYRVSPLLFLFSCVFYSCAHCRRKIPESGVIVYYCGNFHKDLGWISRLLSSSGAAFLNKHHYHRHGNSWEHDSILLNQLLNLLHFIHYLPKNVPKDSGFSIQCQRGVATYTLVKKNRLKAQQIIKKIFAVGRGTWNLSVSGGSRISRRGRHQPLNLERKPILWQFFLLKSAWKWKKLDRRGPPLNPPIRHCHWWLHNLSQVPV